VDGPTDWKGMLPNHWVPQDPRVSSRKLAHVLDDVFELVNRGASNANVTPGHKDDPDLYPVWSPTELGDALIRVGRKMVLLTQPDSGFN
jgi:hypothetical protein